MNGWIGRISRVNLTDNTVYAEDLDPEMAKNYIKGWVLWMKYLLDQIASKLAPLSPSNKPISTMEPAIAALPDNNFFLLEGK